MPYDIETLAWLAVLLAIAAGAFVACRALRRWMKQGENQDALPRELASEGAIPRDALHAQRARLGSRLIRDAEQLPAHEREIVHHALWHAMLLEASADGSVDLREIRVITDLFGRMTGRGQSPESVAQSAEGISRRPQATLSEIAKARTASRRAREHILEGAFLLSLADGILIESEANRLGDIADALGFGLEERQFIFAEMANRLEAQA